MDIIAVPLTHIFLVMITAFGLPDTVKDCKMDWEGYTTTITKTVKNDSTIVAFTTDLGTTRYTFRGTRVLVSETSVDPFDGKKHEATGSYDIKKEFGITDTEQLAKAAEVLLRANGKTATMRLERGERELTVTEASGDSPESLALHEQKVSTCEVQMEVAKTLYHSESFATMWRAREGRWQPAALQISEFQIWDAGEKVLVQVSRPATLAGLVWGIRLFSMTPNRLRISRPGTRAPEIPNS